MWFTLWLCFSVCLQCLSDCGMLHLISAAHIRFHSRQAWLSVGAGLGPTAYFSCLINAPLPKVWMETWSGHVTVPNLSIYWMIFNCKMLILKRGVGLDDITLRTHKIITTNAVLMQRYKLQYMWAELSWHYAFRLCNSWLYAACQTCPGLGQLQISVQ